MLFSVPIMMKGRHGLFVRCCCVYQLYYSTVYSVSQNDNKTRMAIKRVSLFSLLFYLCFAFSLLLEHCGVLEKRKFLRFSFFFVAVRLSHVNE